MSNEQFAAVDALIAKAAQVEGFLNSLRTNREVPAHTKARAAILETELQAARVAARIEWARG